MLACFQLKEVVVARHSSLTSSHQPASQPALLSERYTRTDRMFDEQSRRTHMMIIDGHGRLVCLVYLAFVRPLLSVWLSFVASKQWTEFISGRLNSRLADQSANQSIRLLSMMTNEQVGPWSNSEQQTTSKTRMMMTYIRFIKLLG